MDGASPKIAIVVFSRSGHSSQIAEKLADALDATIIELNTPAYKGTLGYMRAEFDSVKQTCPLAPQSFATLFNYSRVILCGPVLASYLAIPLRALLKSNILLPRSVSLFLTSGSHSPAIKALGVAEADLGRPLAASASLGNKDERTLKEGRILEASVKELCPAKDEEHSEPSFARLHAL